jgi:hypothetical protein
MSESATAETYDVEEIRRGLETDGIIARKGAFASEWVRQVREDVDAAFEEARGREGGAVGRGPNRWYVEIHPQALRGFVDLVDHPWVRATCEAVLGPDYTIVEVGFDTPFPGAKDQPWHRDFRTPPVTASTGRLTSVAFNITTVDVTPDLAPFEIAPGTQFDDGSDYEHGMFPRPEAYGRFQELASRRYPRRGDVSARTGLTVHRGTKNHSDGTRAVLILGMVTGDIDPSEIAAHGLSVTRGYYDALPVAVRAHLHCTVVDELTPIVQTHDIEGLMMGG